MESSPLISPSEVPVRKDSILTPPVNPRYEHSPSLIGTSFSLDTFVLPSYYERMKDEIHDVDSPQRSYSPRSASSPNERTPLKIVIKRRKLVTADVIIKFISKLLVIVFIWIVLWSLTGVETLPPDGRYFVFFPIFILAWLTGDIFHVIRVPPLIGMIIAGFLYANLTKEAVDAKISSALRSFALVIILLRAGLGLDPEKLMKSKGPCLRLSLLPVLVETLTVAWVAHYILGYPFTWTILLGFILASVSVAIVIPGMIDFQQKQMGSEKGIPTLLMVAGSLDNVVAITGFGVALAFVFNNSSVSLTWQILKGPTEALSGLAAGILLGYALLFFPTIKMINSGIQRFILLILMGSAIVLGSKSLDFTGAGPLGVIVLSFVAGVNWRKEHLSVATAEQSTVIEFAESGLKLIWDEMAAVFLFSLIGAEIKFDKLNWQILGYSTAIIVSGIILRCIAAYISVTCANLNWKEKLFVALTWISKATGQAAIAPIALDLARMIKINGQPDLLSIERATTVLTVAVISIVISAPVGEIAMRLSGKKFLSCGTNTEDPVSPDGTDGMNRLEVP